jgi:hypothetical protein
MSKMSKTNQQTQKIKKQTTIKPERDINSKNQKKKKAKQLKRQLNKQFEKIVKNFSKL